MGDSSGGGGGGRERERERAEWERERELLLMADAKVKQIRICFPCQNYVSALRDIESSSVAFRSLSILDWMQ
jgi:hypothetical protein